MDLSAAPVWLQALVLGLVQGLTEFLPVSSSGHLVLIPALTGWPYLGKSFDVALHFGTLLAIVGYFRVQVTELGRALEDLGRGRGSIDDPQRRLALWLILGTVPAGLVGLPLDKLLEERFAAPLPTAILLIAFAFVLAWTDRVGPKRKELHQLSWQGVVLVGCAQALALLPGVSRSGATISACLWLGLTRAEAARFSFLLALPVTAGAVFLKGLKLIWLTGPEPDLAFPCLLGIASSAVTGWLCIHGLLRYLNRSSFRPFVIYRVVLGLLILIWLH